MFSKGILFLTVGAISSRLARTDADEEYGDGVLLGSGFRVSVSVLTGFRF